MLGERASNSDINDKKALLVSPSIVSHDDQYVEKHRWLVNIGRNAFLLAAQWITHGVVGYLCSSFDILGPPWSEVRACRMEGPPGGTLGGTTSYERVNIAHERERPATLKGLKLKNQYPTLQTSIE